MTSITITPDQRQPAATIEGAFHARRSTYAFDPAPLGDAAIASLLEAARWAPSSFNEQPWRFHVATRGAGRDALDAAIMAGNRVWSDQAPAIIWVIAQTAFGEHSYAAKMGLTGEPNRHAWFDTGAAVMQLTLQAHALGLATHAMGGIDPTAAHRVLGLPAHQEVIAALAVGRPGDPDLLPDTLQARQSAPPSGRLPLAKLIVGDDA